MDLHLININISELAIGMANADSTRFLVQMIMNVVICKYAKNKISKIATKKQGKRALKSYLLFLAFVIIMVGLNQTVYFLFKPRNLYEELNIPRSMPPDQIKAYQDELKIKIMQTEMPMNQKIGNIRKLEAMVQVLTHPARRLSYDTFGETDTSYAWAFKNHFFLLSTLMGASIFYIMCTFINMISDKKGEIKEVFKLEIMAMILLFLWEVELIMKTQTRIHQHTDSLDSVYTAFPIYQRRQMIKIILIPCMNIIKFFYRFYVRTESEKKFLQIAKNPKIREMVQKTSEIVRKTPIDQYLQEKVEVAVKEASKTEHIKSQIFALQRKVLQFLILLEGENIFMDEQVGFVLRYFTIGFKQQA